MKPPIDARRFGKRLQNARNESPYAKDELGMVRLAEDIESKFGVGLKASTLYGYENGRTVPDMEQIAMIVSLIRPEGGLAYLAPAFREDIRDLLFPKDD